MIYYEYDNLCLSLILIYLFKRQRKTGLPIMKFNDEDIMIDDLYVYVLIIYVLMLKAGEVYWRIPGLISTLIDVYCQIIQ